ncbi:hypothetical protein [Singulisphaera acidiphila]|uniref:DUF3244 domain-containing protein n=1 Tax=Singulisphaera acidiphila (strain ATCC BAA-1392 / DSM 18658 / VKM B-2454 / MOB10) TaxID=886293 RepID=L0D901_SINAD|nr:hypothetical protein [Singulisphaera acidiphila]AGA25308.1 hypothetical protein Sinac_0903 [Singulisphaera acidiphila DSM 18658]
MGTKITQPRAYKTISLGVAIVGFCLGFFAITDAKAEVNIRYPVMNQDVTSEAGYLVVSGDLFRCPLAVVQIRDADGNLFLPIYQYADSVYLEAWIAIFSLPPGTYTLYVEDMDDNFDIVSGIYVAP